MVHQLLIWSYVSAATLPIVHEIDSAYWREWELFRLPGGHAGFIILHVPLVLVLLFGLLAVVEERPSGIMLSLLVAAGGIFAFVIHDYFLRRGRAEFAVTTSRIVLGMLLIASVVLLIATTFWYGTR